MRPPLARARVALLVTAASLIACDPGGPTGGSPTPLAGDPPGLVASVGAQSGSDGYGGVGYVFAPSTVTILLGGTVTWNNSSGDAHTVTFAGVSNPLANGTQYVRTFNAAGSFSYTCSLHGGMSGSVTVVAP